MCSSLTPLYSSMNFSRSRMIDGEALFSLSGIGIPGALDLLGDLSP